MMALIRSSGNLLMVVKSELEGTPGSVSGGGDNDTIGLSFPTPPPRLSVTKGSWIVRTESNVWREEIKRPSPPCVKCRGTGRMDCFHCQGKGRTNFVDQAMLPKGEWPKWCKSCGGSGLAYCSRCLGTGEYRETMGSHFMKSGERYGKKSSSEP